MAEIKEGSTLVKRAKELAVVGAIVASFFQSTIAKFTGNEKKSGGLDDFRNTEFVSFNDWASDNIMRMDELMIERYRMVDDRLRGVERHIDKEIGANEVLRNIPRPVETHTNQWTDEWMRDLEIVLKRNMKTQELFYDIGGDPDKRVHALWDMQNKAYYYIDEHGKKSRCL